MKTAAFVTFGCKLNHYETEAIREEVLALGYEEVSPGEGADVYVVNTCSVTRESFLKSRRGVLRAVHRNPEARILVVGCSTEAERRRLEGIPQVALLAGAREKHLVAPFLAGLWRPGEPPPAGRRDTDLQISRSSTRARATIKVQDGCDQFCSFCIIPFLRGRSRSRAPDRVVSEARRLVLAGHRELVISGVHVQDYGSDLEGESLPTLLRRVAEVPGLVRARLSSLSPLAFTQEFLEVVTRPPFCPHWHVPLQSGSDAVLERMRRGYRVEDFRRVVEALRTRVQLPSISTDVIVGFPGETCADFEATLSCVREFGFSRIHVFPFSAREGTLAARLEGRIDPEEIRRRSRELRLLADALALEYARRFLGREVEVLVEGPARASRREGARACGTGGAPEAEGVSDRYLRVRFVLESPEALEGMRGSLRWVRLTDAGSESSRGDLVGEDPELQWGVDEGGEEPES